MQSLHSKTYISAAFFLCTLALTGCGPGESSQNRSKDQSPSKARESASQPALLSVASDTDQQGEIRQQDETRRGSARDQAGEENSASPPASKAKNDLPAHPFPRHYQAPSLAGGAGWLNTSAPIEIRQLRGKFVLLDFWTYCCINCFHVLPELKKLEKAYPNHLVVIGVHSAKFEKEKNNQNIREAIQRYEIHHPVVNDSQMKIWDRYHINSWPSMALIDPEGNYVGKMSGEKTVEQLSAILDSALPYYKKKGVLDEKPVKFDLEIDKLKQTPLRFPGKVLADGTGDRLFIADSNHNRIVVANLAGKLLYTIGNGQVGSADGSFDECSFNHPQGLALDGDLLYVADTENHLLRQIDLKNRRVETIAGTGSQRRSPWPGLSSERDAAKRKSRKMRFSGNPRTTAISSPWALWVHEESLFIAMAGPHQIWELTLDAMKDKRELGIYSGSGQEDIVDGDLLSPSPYMYGFAAFAQPSGLASDGSHLFVADSEGASIRKLPLPSSSAAGAQKDKRKRVVTTIVGTAGLPRARLFTFGDRDGKGLLSLTGPAFSFQGEAGQVAGPLLQHPLGVAYDGGKLYVADTYNDKIKVIHLKTNNVRTIKFTRSNNDKKFSLDEPAGISVAAGKLYVADTNNHRICVVDLQQKNRISVLEISGLEPPKKKRVKEKEVAK